MYGYHTSGSEAMVCQHIADWSRQVLGHVERLREQGVPAGGLEGWPERFATLEAEATALLNPWHWGAQGPGAVAQLLERAHLALIDYTRLAQELSPGQQRDAAPAEVGPVPVGEHKLPPLPYPVDGLEPYIDAQTVALHHGQHHRAHVEGLNRAERELVAAHQAGDYGLIRHWEREGAYHGASHYLHALYWESLSPEGGGEPPAALLAQIEQDFGGLEPFRQHLVRASEAVEGAGWAVWAWSPRANRTEIRTMAQQQSLSQWEAVPLLALDLWEHAYYLKYQHDKRAYIDAWWQVIDWQAVAQRYERVRHLAWAPY